MPHSSPPPPPPSAICIPTVTSSSSSSSSPPPPSSSFDRSLSSGFGFGPRGVHPCPLCRIFIYVFGSGRGGKKKKTALESVHVTFHHSQKEILPERNKAFFLIPSVLMVAPPPKKKIKEKLRIEYNSLLAKCDWTHKEFVLLQMFSDPTNVDKFNVSSFFHVKNNLKVTDPDDEKARSDPSYYLKNANIETRETLLELYKEFKGDDILAATMKEPEKKKTDRLNAAHYSTGRVSASFTSTAMAPETTHEAAAIDDDVVRYRYVKKKGYVRLHTNQGDLNLELHCDMTPKTCENFIKLCKKKYYDGTIFHRSIRNFVIQGGDPTGTGTGGESYWGKPFKDELRPNLSHTGRGVLSMANTGPNTNKSQFFITFRSCAYLDKKHTIFGRVVGGFETLTAMENIESDPKTDRPQEEIKIESTTVFVDPYEEADAQVAQEREKAQQEEEATKRESKEVPKKEPAAPKTYRTGVGKYINIAAAKGIEQDQTRISLSQEPVR
uniref:Peptidylprolyl isomerase like 2 n=1 Tax=Pseudonaja textilis TaxID=8673 RepID=A0A670YKZ2_PSETE